MGFKLLLISGKPSTGKTVLAKRLENELRLKGAFALAFDGNDFRRMMGEESMTRESFFKVRNFILRFIEVLREKDIILILSLVADKESFRRSLLEKSESFHVHLVAEERILRERDEKRVYHKADMGEVYLPGYTEGYEEVADADVILRSDTLDLEAEVFEVLTKLEKRGWI
ncbi:MAG: hypothetical protein DRG83_19870 [Deltaproteobacteria bacterium]|nr:MAG: hypothetical protein DRG83_19870 [Deltaproteobacteria bacterium]